MPELPKYTKQYCLGALAGALFAIWMGFGNFGWMLTRTAEAHAKKQSEIAVNAAYAGICREQFRSGADFPARIAALEKTDRWSRGDAVMKAGYAKIPGVKEPSRDIGQACADLLIPEKPVAGL